MGVQQTAGVDIPIEKLEVVEEPGKESYIKVTAPDLVAHVKEMRKAAGLEGVEVGVTVGVS